MAYQMFSIIAPVLAGVGIGFGWARSGRPFDADLVMSLISSIGAPCLIFHTLANVDVEPAAFGRVAGAAAAAIALFLATGYGLLRALGLSLRTYLPSIAFPNTGNMGLPLSYLAYGDVGLVFGVAAFTAFSVVHFTAGQAIASGNASSARLFRVPLVWGVVLALPFLFTATRPPAWINATTDLFGGMAIPIMMITLGVSLARMPVGGLGRSAALAAFRLGFGFAAGVSIAWVFGLEGPARGVLILDCAMPAAVFNYLFAQRYGNAPEEVAGTVVISTALSFFTLPALLWFIL